MLAGGKTFQYLAATISLKIQSRQMSALEKVVVGLGLIHHLIVYSKGQTLSGYRAVTVEENSWDVSAGKNVISLEDRGPV